MAAPNVICNIMPNWKFAVSLQYGFSTVVTRKRRKGEQRKALYGLPMRIQEFSVTDNKEHSLIWHYLISIRGRQIILPIFSEPCKPRSYSELTGETIVYFKNYIPGYYNLRELTTQMIIVDLTDTRNNELLTIRRVHPTNRAVEFTSGIVDTFLGSGCVLFPIYNCYLTKKKRTDYSDTMTKIDLEFTEYR
jgi:hypothetical protein